MDRLRGLPARVLAQARSEALPALSGVRAEAGADRPRPTGILGCALDDDRDPDPGALIIGVAERSIDGEPGEGTVTLEHVEKTALRRLLGFGFREPTALCAGVSLLQILFYEWHSIPPSTRHSPDASGHLSAR